MHRPRKVFWSFQSALDERLINNYFRSDVGQFSSLPCLHLFSHRLEIPLHAIDTNGNTVDQRERLRVLGEHRSKVSRKRHVRADKHAITTSHRETHALVVRVAQADGKATTLHFGCEIKDSEHLHPIWRDGVLVVDDSDVAKS